jgi:hypothetical protein
MRISVSNLSLVFCAAAVSASSACASTPYETGRKAVESFAGCYLVDYSYTETESLKPGYERDKRVYDVNTNKSIKEWIAINEISPNRLRVQHVLFGTDLAGKHMEGSELRHQAEDWEFEAPFLYDFAQPNLWKLKDLRSEPRGQWTRRITNLDDGLRYQCAAEWKQGTEYAEWTCSNYAPIPGRETRDMSRRDYNTMERQTKLVAYGSSFLERQYNTKVQHEVASGVKTPLVKEQGKNWYVRLPDSECAQAQKFAQDRKAFWELLRETWDTVLIGDRDFKERSRLPGGSRYSQVMALEEEALKVDLSNPAQRKTIQDKLLKIISDSRIN